MTKEDEWALEQNLNHVIANFDFDTVEKAMKKLKWKWAVHGESEFVVPNQVQMIDSIRERFYELLHAMTDNELNSVSIHSGGFTVMIDMPNHYVNVRFVIHEKCFSDLDEK
jgi:hypothetical protein